MKNKIILRTVIMSLILNIILTLLKIVFGLLGNAQSLISDGVNSLADVLVSILLLVTLRIANKRPDKTHPYGHEKFEGVMHLILSFIIVITSAIIFIGGLSVLIDYLNQTVSLEKPELFTIYIAITALVIKFLLFYSIQKVGKKYNSKSLKADSKNHLFDMIATSISLISIFLAQFGFVYFEPIASMLIAVIILYVGIKMIRESISYLVDEAPSTQTMDKIRNIILSVEGVIKIDDLKVRRHMNQYYVDVEIAVLNTLSLESAHEISEIVHSKVESKMDVIHCMVHVNPFGDDL